jgi:glycosyltransferase involved in cell wall biosynthesis
LQSYPSERVEVIIADGGSTDGTVQAVEAFAARYPEFPLRLVDNPRRIIPAGLNAAIAESRGEIVVRLDAHSEPATDYLERCVAVLAETQAACVGGRWEIVPGRDSWIGRSIAVAAGHPLGAGDARYRTGGPAGAVDTVPFGAFPRQWLNRVGGFDEQLLTNEDYEYNLRLRRAGGRVWFDPSIRSKYVARGSYSELARQYLRYGYWKGRMLRRYPSSIRLRQLLPPLFVIGSGLLVLAASFFRPAAWLLAATWTAYAAVLLAAGAVAALRKGAAGHLLGVPVALATMHLAWGSGALRGLLGRGDPEASAGDSTGN